MKNALSQNKCEIFTTKKNDTCHVFGQKPCLALQHINQF